jgi:multiple antibiotic resistance protein
MSGLFISVLVSIFSVVNPIGAIPVFLSMTPHYTKQERERTALLTSIYFVLILLAFFWLGADILGFFGISIHAMRMAGGLVILSSGYALLSGTFAESRAIDDKVEMEALEKEDISFSPMAMPMLSGPGSISLLISLFSEHQEWAQRGIISLVILTTGGLVYWILRVSPYLFRILGEAGLRAVSRIMGFIVMAIAVQYIITGAVELVRLLWMK